MTRARALLFGLLLLATPARAPAQNGRGQAGGAQAGGERLELRVLSGGANATVMVDRGSSDGLAVGDAIVFRPRAGGEYRGTVISLNDRAATVELHERSFVPPPGTRGEAFVPETRRRAPPPPAASPRPAPPGHAPAPRDHPPWQNRDDGFTPDRPLLAQIKPIDPRDRASRLGGRFFTFADLNYADAGEFDNSLLRTGVDAWLDNPFRRGGALRFDGEIDHRTEENDVDGLDLTVRELSYHEGGTRFAPMRWQVGRFLQADVPQLGLLDGAAWSQRRENGHTVGASVGFLPELDDDMHTGEDLQVAGFYRLVDSEREATSLTVAAQKTFHQGKADRDLIVLDARRLPTDGWDLRASAWIDVYTGGARDAAKGKGVELTHVFASAGRRLPSGSGFDLAYRRLRFPAQLRSAQGPVDPDHLRNDRYDRLTLTGWMFLGAKKHRAHGQLAGFDDQTTDGGAIEAGIDVQDVVFADGHADVTVFGSAGSFGSSFGGRATLGRTLTGGRWDAAYEIALHHFDGFTANRDDLLQHRVHATRSFELDPHWHLTTHAGAHFFDGDTAWSAGFYLQRGF